VSFERTLGHGQPVVTAIDNNAVASASIPGSTTFSYNLQSGLTNLQINGVVRQDGAGTADGRCVVYGSALRVP
jgi:hypothetical protein